MIRASSAVRAGNQFIAGLDMQLFEVQRKKMPPAELATSGKYAMAAADMNGGALRTHSAENSTCGKPATKSKRKVRKSSLRGCISHYIPVCT
jgi:hypothetical protein